MIAPENLRAFMRGFYGYGSYGAKYWFIGPEEGGQSSVGDLARRIDVWCARGEHEIEDSLAFHEALNHTRWFGEAPKRQATWARLSQILLTAEGRPCANRDILEYQGTRLGRWGGDTLVAELMPLPAKNTTTWYASGLNMPELISRKDYQAVIRPRRIAHLKQRILEHQPHVVIFYGARHLIPGLLGIDFEPQKASDAGWLGRTRLLAMKHPTAFGARREDFDEVARSIAIKT
jgi:hypothetical protein